MRDSWDRGLGECPCRAGGKRKGYPYCGYPWGPQKVGVCNESRLYALIFKSRKPEAKRFRQWVTSEVLPSIRKRGAYVAPAAALPNFSDTVA
ncbi:TPA: hypothetical protein QDB03_002874 [Burkholderia vietnamiensis]|nr:hypothetical protein [Burkholderia vietnamiensis]